MRQKIIAGNWKMHGQQRELVQLCHNLKQELAFLFASKVNCIVFPPVIYLPIVAQTLQETAIKLGGQNFYPANSGAYTGEISAAMLREFGCSYVLVGHSERRKIFKEDEIFVAQKFHHAKEHDMIPVLCVGETSEERENQQTQEVIRKQIMTVAGNKKDCFSNSIIAYEPVWAIGTGKTASPEQAQEVHHFIRSLVSELNAEHAAKLPILYGGSVNEKNSGALFAMPDIDGGLVGGASLNAKQFVEIVKCIN